MYLSIACAVIAVGLWGYRRIGIYLDLRPMVELSDSDWQVAQSRGHVLGNINAPIEVVAFGCYQCPPSAYFFLRTWPAIAHQFGDTVSLRVRHAPLSYYEHAYQAARAAECAAEQDFFEEVHTLLYQKQDSLGQIEFGEFAERSGIPDKEEFDACIAVTEPLTTIAKDIDDSHAIKVRGTPTIVVQGTRFGQPPDSIALSAFIREIISDNEGG